jgi:hypothetical protein
LLGEYVSKLRWCFWHANPEKAEQRMRQILMLCRIVVPGTPKFKESLQQLDFRLREFFAYLESNKGTTIAYGEALSGRQTDFDGDGRIRDEPGAQCPHVQQSADALDTSWRAPARPGSVRSNQR